MRSCCQTYKRLTFNTNIFVGNVYFDMMKIICFTLLFISFICHAFLEDPFECKDNVPYVLDGQYPCECLRDFNHTLNCDLSHCPEKPHSKVKCNLGTKWKHNCNDCFCRILGVVCTNFECTKN